LLEPELQRMRTRGKKTPGQPDFMPTDTPSSEQIASEIMADEAKAAEFDKVWSGLGNALTNTPAGYGLPVTEETTPDMSFNLPFVSNVDTTGGLQQVTDFATIDEIMRSKTQSVTKDLGNGLTLIAYRDPETGRYVKTYRRSNAVPIQPMSDNSILRQSEVPMTQRTLGRAFYGA